LEAPVPDALRPALREGRYQYAVSDLLDRASLEALLRAFRPELIIHLAAALRDDPADVLFRTNVEGTVSLLEAICGSGIETPRFVLGSSGAVYGSAANEALPLREGGARVPIDLYGVSKLAMEEAARVVASRSGIALIVARLFNPIGPGGDERHLTGWLAAQVAAIEAGVLPPVVRVGPLDTTRDFLDVRDTAAALGRLAQEGRVGGVYNVASGEETPTRTILQTVLRLTSMAARIRVVEGPRRQADVPRHFADVTALDGLGFHPGYSQEDSISDLLNYYRGEVRRAAPPGTGVTRAAMNAGAYPGPEGTGESVTPPTT
jgi:GDP-4-dehydro-6-deoxy-D-mannose reductase